MKGARNEPKDAFENANDPLYNGFARVPPAATVAVTAPATPNVSVSMSA